MCFSITDLSSTAQSESYIPVYAFSCCSAIPMYSSVCYNCTPGFRLEMLRTSACTPDFRLKLLLFVQAETPATAPAPTQLKLLLLLLILG